MARIPLKDVCSTLRDTQSPAAIADESVWHFSIPAFDEDGKPRLEQARQIGSSKLVVDRPCLLFSRLNPRIPRVWDLSALPMDRRCLASTEFVPFVIEDPARLHSRYLYWFLHSRAFVTRARAGVRAATKSRERVQKEALFEITVPLAALAEQRRIAAMLDKADAVRRKRRESLRLLDEFLRSAFLEMFGDPVTNEKGWEVGRVGDVVVDAQYGTSAKANTEHRGLPVLRMNNLTETGALDLVDLKWCEIPEKDRDKLTVRRGDLLFNRTNSPELVGKCAVWDRDEVFAFAGYLIRVRFDESVVLPAYVSGYLNSGYGKRMLFERAKPSINMSNISATGLRRLPIPLPRVELQYRYVELVAVVRALAERTRAAIPVCDRLCDSLAHRAFDQPRSPRAVA